MNIESESTGKKVRSKMDKVLLGVVVGGAVGSILGVTLAPKKGSETRDEIKRKSVDTWHKVSDVVGEKIDERKKKKQGFWHKLNRVFVQKKK